MIKDIIKVHKLLNIKEKRKLYLNVFFKLTLSFLEAISVLSFIPFLTFISNQDLSSKTPLFFGLLDTSVLTKSEILVITILVPFISIIILNIFRPFSVWYSSRVTNDVWISRHLNLYNYYLRKKFLFHVNNSSNVLLEKLLNRTNSATAGVIYPTYEIFGTLSSAILLVLIPLSQNLQLGLIILVLISIFYSTFFRFFKKKIRIYGEYGPIFSRETYKVVDESLKSIKDIKLRKNYFFYVDQIFKKLKKYANNGVKFDFYSSIPRTITEIIGFGSILLVAIYLITTSDFKIENTVVTLGIYLLALQRLIPIIQNLFIQISSYKLHSPTFASIYDDLLNSNTFDLLIDKSKTSLINKNSNKFREIKFENINFCYPNNKNFTLKIQDLKITSGDVIVVKGKSGHGKSTFLNIFTGLIQITSGNIVYNNQPIKNNDFEILQKKIAYVPQNIFIHDESIEKNIAFGVEKEMIDKDRVRNACKIAGLDNFVENELKEKYETIVGENAIKLSGGQRQRIGIARAIYDNKEILILDEATNALDEEKAKEIIDKISNVKNITIILVTHNQLIIKKFDKVLHFNNGKLEL